MVNMIDHLSSYTTHFEAAKKFYDAVLPTLGYQLNVDMVASWDKEFPTRRVAAYGPPKKPAFWLIEAREPATRAHVAFTAPNRAAVHAFHEAAMSIGAKDNGPPGPRPMYHEHYYGAFALDPDGHNVEAVCHQPVG